MNLRSCVCKYYGVCEYYDVYRGQCTPARKWGLSLASIATFGFAKFFFQLNWTTSAVLPSIWFLADGLGAGLLEHNLRQIHDSDLPVLRKSDLVVPYTFLVTLFVTWSKGFSMRTSILIASGEFNVTWALMRAKNLGDYNLLIDEYQHSGSGCFLKLQQMAKSNKVNLAEVELPLEEWFKKSLEKRLKIASKLYKKTALKVSPDKVAGKEDEMRRLNKYKEIIESHLEIVKNLHPDHENNDSLDACEENTLGGID